MGMRFRCIYGSPGSEMRARRLHDCAYGRSDSAEFLRLYIDLKGLALSQMARVYGAEMATWIHSPQHTSFPSSHPDFFQLLKNDISPFEAFPIRT